jgi:hypothetical protein
MWLGRHCEKKLDQLLMGPTVMEFLYLKTFFIIQCLKIHGQMSFNAHNKSIFPFIVQIISTLTLSW